MDILSFLASINKISLAAFVFIFVLVVFEIYSLRKEKRKNALPSIPNFQEKSVSKELENTKIIVEPNEMRTSKKSTNFLIILLLVFFVVFGTISFLGFRNLEDTRKKQLLLKQIPPSTVFYSEGIKIYDLNWNEIIGKDIMNLTEANTIIIGVEKTENIDIDMARIRINKTDWASEDTTLNFDKKNNVFYKKYQLSSQEARLKIDAQLHSKKTGWLGK